MRNCGKPKDVDSSQDVPPENMPERKGKSKKHKITPCSLAVGRALKKQRERKNLGQGEAALEANFSLSYLSNVERGIHSLSLSKFLSFSEGIHSTPEELCSLLCEEMAKIRQESEDEKGVESHKKCIGDSTTTVYQSDEDDILCGQDDLSEEEED